MEIVSIAEDADGNEALLWLCALLALFAACTSIAICQFYRRQKSADREYRRLQLQEDRPCEWLISDMLHGLPYLLVMRLHHAFIVAYETASSDMVPTQVEWSPSNLPTRAVSVSDTLRSEGRPRSVQETQRLIQDALNDVDEPLKRSALR